MNLKPQSFFTHLMQQQHPQHHQQQKKSSIVTLESVMDACLLAECATLMFRVSELTLNMAEVAKSPNLLSSFTNF